MESVNFGRALVLVFRTHFGIDSSAPVLEALGFEVGPHEFDDLGFRDAELELNRLKRRAIFPSHFNDSCDVCFFKRLDDGTLVGVLRIRMLGICKLKIFTHATKISITRESVDGFLTKGLFALIIREV